MLAAAVTGSRSRFRATGSGFPRPSPKLTPLAVSRSPCAMQSSARVEEQQTAFQGRRPLAPYDGGQLGSLSGQPFAARAGARFPRAQTKNASHQQRLRQPLYALRGPKAAKPSLNLLWNAGARCWLRCRASFFAISAPRNVFGPFCAISLPKLTILGRLQEKVRGRLQKTKLTTVL